MSILDKLLPKDQIKHVDVHQPGDGYDTPTFPTFAYNQPPSLTHIDDQEIKGNPFESSEHMRWLDVLADRQNPRYGELTTHQLLARIADLLSQDRQVDVPSDFTHLRSKSFNAGQDFQFLLEGLTPYGYIYLPPVSVEVSVWLGQGTGQPLTVNPPNTPLNMRIPRIDSITLTFDNPGPAAVTIYAYLSTRPFVLSRDSKSPESLPLMSGKYYNDYITRGGQASSAALVPNIWYCGLFIPDVSFTANLVTINVTALVAATSARLGLGRWRQSENAVDVIADYGLVSTAAVASPSIVINQPFEKGVAYAPIITSDGGATIDQAYFTKGFPWNNPTTASGTGAVAYQTGATLAALPSVITPNGIGGFYPVISFRAA